MNLVLRTLTKMWMFIWKSDTFFLIDLEAIIFLQVVFKRKDAKTAGYKARMTSLRLLRAITFVADSLTELPIKIYLNMRLFYYDESKEIKL